VLYVPKLKKNLLSVSVLEDMGFVVMFKKWQVLIRPEGISTDTIVSIGVREGKLYRLHGKHVCGSKEILDLIHSEVNGSMSMAKDEEQKALKGDQSSKTTNSKNQPSSGEELTPSSSVKRPSWFEMTLRDAHEQVEAPGSTFRENKSSKKFSNFTTLMSNVIEVAANQRVQ
jgi:hypothetical protein